LTYVIPNPRSNDHAFEQRLGKRAPHRWVGVIARRIDRLGENAMRAAAIAQALTIVTACASFGGLSAAQAISGKPPAPTHGVNGTLQKIGAERLIALMSKAGVAAQAGDPRSDGLPTIAGLIAGKEFTVVLGRCDRAQCLDILFTAQFEIAFDRATLIEKVNRFNLGSVFATAYVFDSGAVGVSVPMTVQGGVGEQNILEVLDWFRVVLKAFEENIQKL
jgi:hypothetical protein